MTGSKFNQFFVRSIRWLLLELDNNPPSIDYSRIKQQPYQVSQRRVFIQMHVYFSLIRCHIPIQAMICQISIRFSLEMLFLLVLLHSLYISNLSIVRNLVFIFFS